MFNFIVGLIVGTLSGIIIMAIVGGNHNDDTGP